MLGFELGGNDCLKKSFNTEKLVVRIRALLGRSLDVFITRLRRYLRHDLQVLIVNVRGVGYKLLAEE